MAGNSFFIDVYGVFVIFYFLFALTTLTSCHDHAHSFHETEYRAKYAYFVQNISCIFCLALISTTIKINFRYFTEEDLEHRLEVMLSRRAVAMAHAQHGRVDCVGASKGLFFGLLMLVGSLICLILFFVLIHHPQLGLLAIYLADVSHCVLMVLSIIAIIVGFIR